MKNRSIIPIFDKEGEMVIGVTGRSIFDKCNKCGTWHDNNCPSKEILNDPDFCKWRHSFGFEADSHLFNYANAIKNYDENRNLILVEGPLDCLKLSEAGYNNTVALFGTNLSDQQLILLEGCGAYTITLLLDNDEAGQNAIKYIQKSLDRLFKIKIIKLDKKDPGSMTIEELKGLNL